MLNRKFLDDKCSGNDPGRVRDIKKCPTEMANIVEPKNEFCEQQNLVNQPEMMLHEEEKNEEQSTPPYFPQPDDDLPAKDEGPMMPLGPWATGRVVYSPINGMTGLRPVVDRYSITRFSPAEWRLHNKSFFDQSKHTINDAKFVEKISRENNMKIYKDTDKIQLDNRDKLSERSSLIHKWKTELERALFEITEEIELLEGEHRRVKQTLSVLTIPESISGEFLEIRTKRMESDLVRDEVDKELIKEVALCSETRNMLNNTCKIIETQLLELKTAKTRMEFDLTDKTDAYEIDKNCVGLSNSSSIILKHPGATRVPTEQSTPDGYNYFTKEALEMGEAVKNKSVEIRSTLNDIYLKIVKDLRNQAIQVDAVLAENISQTEMVFQHLEKELTQCLNQLSDTEKLIEELRGATKGLDDALKVAQSRLSDRLNRRNVESCRDTSQSGLIEEVKIINDNLSLMAKQLKIAEQTQAGLVKSRGDLEREIIVKKKTLFVDRDRGQLLRSYYPSAEALSGH
ncbi:hypothetical protein HCN44_005229 [Aphidius gifuensis]|uniref:Tektin n=2 Tax=Aphidius gifuensis TaxID=684658 RepID=A0A835CU23_APHGI|nr:tektin-4-like isoform X2 [Aphidius gifuensis]KAF7992885.1 hypothetical protein HCN44_005229 [Aphidius gifuensis]